jgi:hypothetical protein
MALGGSIAALEPHRCATVPLTMPLSRIDLAPGATVIGRSWGAP